LTPLERTRDRFVDFAATRPGWALCFHAAVTLFFLTQLFDFRALELRLLIQTEIEKILPADGEDREAYARFRELFGNYEMLFVGVAGADVFTAEGLERIRRLTRRFEDIDGVRRVLSLSNAPAVRSDGEGVRISSAFDEVPRAEAELARVRERILADPMYAGNLVSPDGQATALLVYPAEMSEREFRERGIDQEVERIAREEVGEAARVLVAGNPPLKATTGRLIQTDVALLMPLSFVFMGLIAAYSFRSLPGVVVPLACIGLSLVWTTGTMVVAGRNLNLITFIVPILINTLGFAYSCHVVSAHDEQLAAGRSGREAASRAVRGVAFPIFLTAATTAAGFLSLCLSRLPAIREFGAFCVVATVASLTAAITFAPALLAVIAKRPRPPRAQRRENAIVRMAPRFADFDLRHPEALIGGGALVLVLALVGVTQIVVSTSFVANLKPDHPLRRSSEAFDEELGGSTTFHVYLEGGSPDFFQDPVWLGELQSLQRWLDDQDEVSKTTSLADYLMVINRAFHDGDPAKFAIPESERAITQLLTFFWTDGLSDLADSTYQAAHILVRAPAINSQGINGFVDRVERRLATLPEPIVGKITGDTVLIGRTMDEIAWGQALTLSSAVLIIYAILFLYFRSARTAFLALIPNTLPVTVYFGVLGLTGVTLNIITSLVACVVLGIAVDDTIHFIVHYRTQMAKLRNPDAAAKAALRAVIRPVTSTTLALCVGFLAFAGSGLRHQVEFALLSTSMLAFAWLVDMTFTPALCVRMGIAGERERGPTDS
jgi:predicted RND superfamily exporter protein